jgi:hypothetical protein
MTDQSTPHPIEALFAFLDAIPHELYPEPLVPVAGRHVDGVAGFPAGRGLYADCGWDHAVPPPFPVGGLMLVGNHLDAEDSYLERRARGEANGDPCSDAPRMRFWTMLYALLDTAGIPRSKIFVTNAHPALIRGNEATGTVRWTPAWFKACAELFERELELMRPRAIAAMGSPAQQLVARVLGVGWTAVPERIDVDIDGRSAAVLAIRHPSAAQSLPAREETAVLLAAAMA